jgi:hypothetical protein
MTADLRHIETGHEIPSEGYCDQPYVVVNDDGSWTCVMTTGRGHEGQAGQHVVATISQDQGKTWSDLYDIEPADGPEASWVMPLRVPETGRIYAFYTYNKANQREVKTVTAGCSTASIRSVSTPTSTPMTVGAPGRPSATKSRCAASRSIATTSTAARCSSSGAWASRSCTTARRTWWPARSADSGRASSRATKACCSPRTTC